MMQVPKNTQLTHKKDKIHKILLINSKQQKKLPQYNKQIFVLFAEINYNS